MNSEKKHIAFPDKDHPCPACADAPATCGCLSGRDCRCKIHNRNHNQCLPSDPAAKAIEKGRIFNHRDGMAELRRFDMEAKARELRRVLLGAQAIPSEKNDIDYICAVFENQRKIYMKEFSAALAAERKARREEDKTDWYYIECVQRGYRRGLKDGMSEIVDDHMCRWRLERDALMSQLQAADKLAKAVKKASDLDNNYRGLTEWVAIEKALAAYDKAKEEK